MIEPDNKSLKSQPAPSVPADWLSKPAVMPPPPLALQASVAAPPPAPPTTPPQAPQWFCRKCRKVVPTERRMNPVYSPVGNKLNERHVCRHCRGEAIAYTVEELAKLLWEQMTLLSEAAVIQEQTRKLHRDLQDTVHHRWYCPQTGCIVNRHEVENGEIMSLQESKVRGANLPAYRVTTQGLKAMLDKETKAAEPPPSAKPARDAELEALRARVKDLELQVHQLGGVPAKGGHARASRNINL